MNGKQIVALCGVVVAVIGIPTAFFGMMRGCHDVGKSAAERRKAEEELEGLRREKEATDRSPGATAKAPPPVGTPVSPPKTPTVGKKDDTKDGSNAAIPPAQTLKRVPAEVSQPSPVRSEGFQVQLESSLLEGDELACTVHVTKTDSGPQRKMKYTVGGPSLTLSDGTRVKHFQMEIGGSVVRNGFSGVRFDKDIPLKIVIRFRPVESNTTRLTLLDLAFYGITFRDAPVQRLVAE
jgi:hypothetical protein